MLLKINFDTIWDTGKLELLRLLTVNYLSINLVDII